MIPRAVFGALIALSSFVGLRPGDGPADRPTASTGDLRSDTTVLATLGQDTVALVRKVEGDNRLVWTSGSERWDSGTLGYGGPEAQLLYVDQDFLPDLFFRLVYEEFVFGEVILGGPERAGVVCAVAPGWYE